MGRPLSVGAKWTLRYSLAVLVTVSVLAVVVYDRVERRITQDAQLLLDHQVTEIRKGILRSGDRVQRDEFLGRKIEVGEGTIGLGVSLHDADGETVHRSGSLAAPGGGPAVPREVLYGFEDEAFYEAELGRNYPFFVMARPLDEGFLQVAIYSRPFVRRADHIADVLGYSIPVLLVLTAGLGFWLARSSLRPIAEITATARRISAAHLEEVVPMRGTGDELDQLAGTLNEMLGRIRAGVERTRRFSVDASRELRAPLLTLQRQIHTMLEREGLPEWHRKELRQAEEEADVLAEAVNAMLRVAWSEDPGRRTELPIAPVLESVADAVETEADSQDVTLRREPFPDVVVRGDPFQLHQLFASLLQAAVRATPSGGSVTLGAGVESGELRITFRRSDPKEDPLGGPIHAVAREILRAHGGTLEVREGEATQAVTVVTLPTV